MSSYHDRLIAVRAELARLGLDGFILATGDEHITEYPAPYSKRLAWLTGFSGSTASVAVLASEAAIFVDGRYVESVRKQVAGTDWSYQNVREASLGDWLRQHAEGKRIGYDPKLYTRTAIRAIEARLATKVTLVALGDNPIDPLWTDQPTRPMSSAFVQRIELSGKSSADKRRDITEWLRATGADACVIVALDSIAWLFNIRGRDVDVAPFCYSFAICHEDGTADLFVAPQKIDEAVQQHLGNSVRRFPYDDFHAALGTMRGQTVSLDPNLTPAAIYAALEASGATVREERDPTVLAKSIKNPVEIAGMRQAHLRDGAALTRFLHWLSTEAPKGGLTELSAAARLNQFRRETERFHGLSFDPISCADANASMPHYSPTPESDAAIGPDSIYLIDSGGQYVDGTTDVTRTVAFGETSAEVKDRFTRVLKGYIALQTTTFPAGTLGSRLDAIARVPLWAGGVDCAHGIGHGVGAFLNVHEGPAYILSISRPDEAPLEEGMILSNEPGFYKTGHYGLRIENLMLVVARPIEGSDRNMLGFEPITVAPIDRKLIEPGMLTATEIAWLDSYHAAVLAQLGPLLSSDQRHWLEQQTAPIQTMRPI